MRVCRFAVPANATAAAAEAAALTEACLEAGVLTQAAVPGAQAPGDRWLHLGTAPTGSSEYNASFVLPANVTCDGVTARCVLQWYYLTGNSCNPPGEPAQYIGDYGVGTCGAGGSTPEEVSARGGWLLGY